MTAVRLEPWTEGDLPLLRKLMGDPEMTRYLGGPETEEKLAKRQARYERPGSGMFKIVDAETGEHAGSVGYWEKDWRDQQVYETGWMVLPAFQGRGIAVAATAELVHLGTRRRLDDVVDVDGHRTGVREQPHVDLLGLHELVHDPRRLPQQRPELGHLRVVQLAHASHVALRLDDERADPERADA